MKAFLSLILLSFSLALEAQVLRTESHVNVEEYVGKWYALKSLPQFFTRKCEAQTAEYKVIDEKTISVLNTCLEHKGQTTIKGKAVVKNLNTNAELIVTFDNFFTRLFRVKGDYNIIKLDPNYLYVLVGSKDRKSLWIMSRTMSMPEEIMDEYVQIAKEEGFSVNKLIDSKF
jgi:apolipoprotein D and lipocalin family protein